MWLIGITGYAGSGKDSLANVLVDHHGFERVAFADPVRDLYLQINPIVRAGRRYVRLSTLVKEEGWDAAKRKYPDVRRGLQGVGQGVRLQDPLHWIDQAGLSTRSGKVVVTDVRYANEAVHIGLLGGIIARMEAPGVGPVNGHISETEAMTVVTPDVVVENDLTTRESLERGALKVMSALRHKR